MMTPLPYPNVHLSAHVLSARDLSVARSSAMRILRALTPRYQNSDRFTFTADMWLGYERYLVEYLRATIVEWKRRGYGDDVDVPDGAQWARYWCISPNYVTGELITPPWMNWERFHRSHRAWLKFQDREWYQQFCWGDKPSISPVWPSAMPVAGEYLVRAADVVLIVQSHQDYFECTTGLDRIDIPKKDVACRIWRKGVPADQTVIGSRTSML